MQVRLSNGSSLQVSGAPPVQRHAVLQAHPLPQVPIIKLKRADGGFDDWEDRNNPEYRRAVALTLSARESALWAFYVEECLDADPPPDWRESETWQALAAAGVKPRSLKLDWVEYELLASPDDERLLKQAFRDANEGSAQDREAAEDFFGVTWDGMPIRDAAERLKRGKLAFNQGFSQFAVAVKHLGLLPLAREELPPDLQQRLVGVPLYYDLPPALRARMEVFVELDYLAEALRIDEATKWKAWKG